MAFQLDSISQLEAIEHGDVEMSHPCMEMLLRDYCLVHPSHIDYGDRCVFSKIPHNSESILARLKARV